MSSCHSLPLLCAGFVFGLNPGVTSTLNWAKLLPAGSRDAIILSAWTLPLMAAFAFLHMLRTRNTAASPQEQALAPLHQYGAIAADRLQRSRRIVPFHDTSSDDDMRLVFAISTLSSCAATAVWLYGVLPPFLARLAAPFVRSNFCARLSTGVLPHEALL